MSRNRKRKVHLPTTPKTFLSYLDSTFKLVDDEEGYDNKAYGIDPTEPIGTFDRPKGWPDGRRD